MVMLNYEVNPDLLAPFVPAGTELDLWEGKAFVSVVGFMFLKTRLKGIPVPFHQNFEELNLRFYVRHKGEEGWRRGVVFIKELVPRLAIAWVARTIYNENYATVPMWHRFETEGTMMRSAMYGWRFNDLDNHLKVVTKGEPQSLIAGSEQEFITEHYWGYARQRDGSSMEYFVEHPRWRVWELQSTELCCDVSALYGPEFEKSLSREPTSAFLADGSEVSVFGGTRI